MTVTKLLGTLIETFRRIGSGCKYSRVIITNTIELSTEFGV